MIEYASFGWATLTWWTWPVLFITVMASVASVVWIDRLAERRSAAGRRGKYPCLAHLVTAHDGTEGYCGDVEGHTGPCGRVIIEAVPAFPFEETDPRFPADQDDQPAMDHWRLRHHH